MATNNDPEISESDVFSLFPTTVWKVRLAPDVSEAINSPILEFITVATR